ncbi:MAG: hypothetical protein JXQ72_01220 [Anaerolineae bacterium]|nr:hypothetical protein [Anaerolineae bacterium]
MRRTSHLLRLLVVLLIPALAACNAAENGNAPIPTQADINLIPTHEFLTQNAPPAGFGQINVDPIDVNLSARQGWRYVVTGTFSGIFDAGGAPAQGIFQAQVWANEIGETRRVILDVEGAALAPDNAPRRLEGVRWSNDTYIVDNNGQCTTGGDGAQVIANLSAGQLIGGVVGAVPTGHRQEIGGYPAWQYTFRPGNARFPAVDRGESGTVELAADLWFAPELNAVLRYEVQLTVAGVRLLSAEDRVSGTLTLRYELDLDALDTLPNISVPNGC